MGFLRDNHCTVYKKHFSGVKTLFHIISSSYHKKSITKHQMTSKEHGGISEVITTGDGGSQMGEEEEDPVIQPEQVNQSPALLAYSG